MNQVKLGWRCLSKIINTHGSGVKDFPGNFVGELKPYGFSRMGSLGFQQNAMIVSRRFGNNFGNENDVDHQLTRDFLVKVWVADRKTKNSRGKKKSKMFKYQSDGEKSVHQYPRLFSGSFVKEDNSMGKGKRVLEQPPLSQSVSNFLDPESPEEVKVAPLLARSNLLITRDIEWANLVFGFEQGWWLAALLAKRFDPRKIE